MIVKTRDTNIIIPLLKGRVIREDKLSTIIKLDKDTPFTQEEIISWCKRDSSLWIRIEFGDFWQQAFTDRISTPYEILYSTNYPEYYSYERQPIV